MKRKTLLLVPGFVCDVFSPIEELSFHLTEALGQEWNVVWLVPTIGNPGNEFKSPDSPRMLAEPLYVTRLREKGYTVVVGDISKYNMAANFLLFRRVFRDYQVDCVLTQFGFDRFVAAFFGRLFGRKVIWYEHWASLKTKFAGPKALFYRGCVDGFLSISSYVSACLPPSKPVWLAKNAIADPCPRAMAREERQALRNELGIGAFRRVVLMIAAFREEKRVDLAVDVADRVLKDADDVCFVFLGEGPLRKAVEASPLAQKNAGKLFFLGHRMDVPRFLSAADVLILTTENEPFGICLLEAMAFALPVVAFDSAGPAEIVDKGTTGYLVPFPEVDIFARHVLDLVRHPSLSAAMGAEGRKRFEKEFTIEKWKARMQEIFAGIGRGL